MNIQEALKGFTVCHCFYVGIKSGILGYFRGSTDEGGISAQSIAEALGMVPRRVQIWLDTAQAFGLLQYSDGQYWIADDQRPYLLDENDLRYQGELVQLFIDHLSTDMKLQGEYLKTGQHYGFSDHDPEFVKLISKRGYLRSQTMIQHVIEPNDGIRALFQRGRLICDIGCGPGAFIKGLCEKYPEPNYMGIDADETSIELAKESDFAAQVSFIHGDIGEIHISEQIDLIAMMLTLHEIDSSARANVLRTCHEQLSPDGRIVIMEFLYPEKASEFNDSRFQMGILDQYFEMLWGTEQIGWSIQSNLLKSAGFKNIERYFIEDTPYVVITATK
jgi:caffeic acid 3-O-methyltransferase